MKTIYDIDISREMMKNKLCDLVNQVYKILPLKESDSPTLNQYLAGLMRELLGFKALIVALHDDGLYASLLSIIQFLSDNDCDNAVVKTDVFKAIGIVKKLQKKYENSEE